MYLDDPRAFVQVRKEVERPKLDPKRQAWMEETWETGKGPRTGKPQPGVMRDNVCVFLDGMHYAGEHCPHLTAQQDQPAVPQFEQPIVWRRVREW